MSAQPMTPAHIAVAIVAACGVTGTKPDKVFEEGNGRARVMAAGGCIARLGWDKLATARAFRVHPNRLTPSGLGLARVTTDHLLAVAEALESHGLTGAKAETPSVSPAPAAAATSPQRKADKASPRPRAQRADPPAEPPAPKATADIRPLRTNRVRPRATATPAVERLKPVTDRVVGWTLQQLALGADLTFVAWCFGVDVDDLAVAVRPERAVAA